MTNGSGLQPNRVAVIVAHPDDEVLGCGGTIRRHVLAGDEVSVIILADGETSRGVKADTGKVAARASAAHAAAKILGVSDVTLHGLADNQLDSRPLLELVKVVEADIRRATPRIVYTHHAGDLNIDHRRVHEAVVTACRPIPGQGAMRLLFFETVSSSEWQPPGSAPVFAPNWFVDISETLDIKLRALKAYAAEMRPWPHPRSYEAIEHIAHWRGATIGRAAAEAFILGREVCD